MFPACCTLLKLKVVGKSTPSLPYRFQLSSGRPVQLFLHVYMYTLKQKSQFVPLKREHTTDAHVLGTAQIP
jgi:hypothetical protein